MTNTRKKKKERDKRKRDLPTQNEGHLLTHTVYYIRSVYIPDVQKKKKKKKKKGAFLIAQLA